MAYQSLYRKWRPQTFSDIVGQEHVTKTLQSEIISGHLSHAYLFCGSRGTGKTTSAKVFAKAVNCENPNDGNPCNQCRCCKGIANGSITDVFEIDAASNNGVDDIRTINTESSYLPSGVRYKIYIIDEVHMLSNSAFNALLKTLEEPPEHVIFILATTESHKIPATILSRCQRFDFRYISDDAMHARLRKISDAEGFDVDDVSLDIIVNAAKGGLRDAVSMLDQCSAYNNGKIDDRTARMVTGVLGTNLLIGMGDAILNHDTEGLMTSVRTALSGGYEASRLAECLISHFRNIIVAESVSDPSGLIEATEKDVKLISAQAQRFGTAKALSVLETLMSAYETVKWSQNPRLILETALIKLAHPKAEASVDALLSRIEALEAKTAGVVSLPMITETPFSSADEEDEEEGYVADIPGPQDFDDFEPMPTMEISVPSETVLVPVAEEHAPVSESVIPKDTANDIVFDRWDEVIAQLEQESGTLAAMAVRAGNFRLNNNRLSLMGIVGYLRTNDTKAAVKKAVKDICGIDVEVVFDDGATVKSDLSGATDENDPLAALANKMAGKINIIS